RAVLRPRRYNRCRRAATRQARRPSSLSPFRARTRPIGSLPRRLQSCNNDACSEELASNDPDGSAPRRRRIELRHSPRADRWMSPGAGEGWCRLNLKNALAWAHQAVGPLQDMRDRIDALLADAVAAGVVPGVVVAAADRSG